MTETELLSASVTDQILSRVRLAGDAVAITDGQRRTTYRQLWHQSGLVAARLLAAGIPAAAPVGVRLASSPELIAVMLGILRAGLIYLPLDPDGPSSRCQRILDDSATQLVVVDASRGDSWLAGAGRRTMSTADLLSDGPVSPGVDWRVPLAPNSPAYIIYTSGSTGRPKGVVVGHRALLGYLRGVEPRYQVTADDVVLQFASPEFDISIEDIVTTLAAGARLVCRPPDLLGSADRLLALCATEGITALNLPTAYWHWLVANLADHRLDLPPAIRQVIVGGEQLLAGQLATWRETVGDRVRVINAYGPTETTVTCTTLDVTENTAAFPPIGTPIDGSEGHVLDTRMRPATVGELYIGGPVVSNGYWSAPRLTAARFVPDPFSGRPGARLYRSGDRIRCGHNGILSFLGRTDDQVKVGGHRIELGEVEAALRESPDVRDAAVVPIRDGASGPIRALAAFLVPAAGMPPTAREIADLLSSRLSGVARPTVLRVVPALPLGPTGKVDRAALDPATVGEKLPAGTDFVPPATEVEQRIREIWAGLLDVDRIGRHDPFLAVGGNSLLALQVCTRLREEFGADVPVSAVLRGATVATIAESLAVPQASLLDAAARELPQDKDDDEFAPLSLTQERVWFLTELEEGNPAYQYQMYVRLHGELQPAALRAALTAVVARHEILRTTFSSVAGEPTQRVHPPFEVTLPVLDIDEVEAAGGAEAVIRRECARGFDVGTLPLIRWTLLRVSADEHLLVHVEHHLLHDGWSVGRVLADLELAYRAVVDGQVPSWPRPASRFRDYARAQRRWLSSLEAGRQKEFWRDRLVAAPPLTELPTDRPRPRHQTFNGGVRKYTVPHGLVRRLTAVAHRNRATVFAVMMAAFAAMVARHSGQRDLLIGTSVANRHERDMEDLVGMVVNNLVLRLDVAGEATVGELVQHVRDVLLESFDHQQLPFEIVVGQSGVERDLRANPLFQLMFSFHDSPVEELDLGAVHGKVGYLDNQTAKFDLNVIVMPRAATLDDGPLDGGMLMEWEYNSDLFDPATVDRLSETYLRLLAGVSEDADATVGTLPMLTADQKDTLVALGDGKRAYPRTDPAGADLWRAVCVQSRLWPDAVAVRWPGGQFSYAALRRRASQLARHLTGLGIGPESVVAVCCGRGGQTVVAALGAYAAGAAFLLIDSAVPTHRRNLMLADSGAAVLLTAAESGVDIDDLDACPTVVHLETDWPAIAAHPATPPPDLAAPGNLAYLIYTSGSTGRPKGVLVPRDGLACYLAWCARQYGIRPGHRVPVHTPFGVDLTITSLFAPLTLGATVDMLPDGVAGLEAVAEVVSRGAADLIKLTPSHLRGIEAQLGERPPDRPLTLVVGGEALFDGDLAPFFAQARTFNEYGPTEAVVGCTVAEWLPDQTTSGSPAVPVGQPVTHARVTVRDGADELAPAGALGELHIGGDALARGYLGAPVATALAFRPDPYAAAPGARAYRSGDLVRWRAGAGLEYLGRTDRQLKVRGHRVHPAEIEAALTELPGVRAAAVRAVDTGDKLVGYLVVEPSTEVDHGSQAVQQLLAARLPGHMVPSAFVMLPELPRAPSGKVDYAALPAAVLDGSGDLAPAAELITDRQHEVARVWREVLEVERVGADSDFFILGGHSLAAVRVVARLRENVQVNVRLHDVFEARTVGALAALIDAREASLLTAGREQA